MRWSETANFGTLPNSALPNTFLSQTFDLGDPMDALRPPCVVGKARTINASAFGPAGPCVFPPASAWNTHLLPMKAAIEANLAPSFMGGIREFLLPKPFSSDRKPAARPGSLALASSCFCHVTLH